MVSIVDIWKFLHFQLLRKIGKGEREKKFYEIFEREKSRFPLWKARTSSFPYKKKK